jgi:Ni/Co efflux regulator RcnB
MKKLLVGAAALSLVLPSFAMAEPFDHDRRGPQREQFDHDRGGPQWEHHGHRHAGWGPERGGGYRFHRGEQIGYDDWSGARPLDYREYHLRRPPYGYEWRESNGQFILAAVATGLIASAIFNSSR